MLSKGSSRAWESIIRRIYIELLDEIQKRVASQTAKVDAYLEPGIEESEPELEVVDEPAPELEVKDSFIGIHVDLLAEPTMKLSSSAMRVALSLRCLMYVILCRSF